MVTKSVCASIAMALLGAAAAPASANILGWFDSVNVAMVDNAYGWICDSASPNTAPAGDLVVKNRNSGFTVGTYSVASSWGGYRPDVPSAGFCGSNDYTGWTVMGWFAHTDEPIDVYYRFPDTTMQLLGGSGKVCNGVGWCY